MRLMHLFTLVERLEEEVKMPVDEDQLHDLLYQLPRTPSFVECKCTKRLLHARKKR